MSQPAEPPKRPRGEDHVRGGGRIELQSLSKSSGCGKTTTLRLIGGFEEIEHGAVLSDMRGVAPEKRPVNTVFQSYALFPHKSVADNVAFGLRFVDGTKADARRRVAEALELVRLTGFEARKPHQLSGAAQGAAAR